MYKRTDLVEIIHEQGTLALLLLYLPPVLFITTIKELLKSDFVVCQLSSFVGLKL